MANGRIRIGGNGPGQYSLNAEIGAFALTGREANLNYTSSSSFTPVFEEDFESMTVGQAPTGVQPGLADVVSSDEAYSGTKSWEVNWQEGDPLTWSAGGIMPTGRLNRGDEVWIRLRAYWPTGFNYDASTRLKFFRVRTFTSGDAHIGYNDIYINNSDNSEGPFRFIYEGENSWVTDIGEESHNIQFEEWETYELYIKFDNVPASSGGMATVRWWKNGELLANITNRRTLNSATDYGNTFYLFTHWNNTGGTAPPVTQRMFIDDIVIATNASPPIELDSFGNLMIGT